MADLDRAATPTWDSETEAAYSRFIASGGDAAIWAAANPELGPAPASAPVTPAKTRPALHPTDAAVLNWAAASWDAAIAGALSKFGRSARGRQGR